MKFERINPMTGKVAYSAEAMQASDISAIAARAVAAFPVWAAMGPNARRAALMKAAGSALPAMADSAAGRESTALPRRGGSPSRRCLVTTRFEAHHFL